MYGRVRSVLTVVWLVDQVIYVDCMWSAQCYCVVCARAGRRRRARILYSTCTSSTGRTRPRSPMSISGRHVQQLGVSLWVKRRFAGWP